MAGFIKTLFSLSVSGTFLTVILFLLKPFYKNKFTKKWQYYIWLIVIARLIIPFTVTSDFNIMENVYRQVYSKLTQPETESNTSKVKINLLENAKAKNSNTNNTDNIKNINNTTKNNTITNNSNAENGIFKYLHTIKELAKSLFTSQNIFYIWLVITIALFTRKITTYQGFIRYLKAGQAETASLELWEEMGVLIEKFHIKTTVRLYTNSLVSSPLLTGFFRPCIIIPSEKIDKTSFKNIICHELVHFKRKDMFYKWLIQLTSCIYWFNPFIYLIIHETNRLCELSCDEAVIKNLDKQGKKEYGNTLLNMADTSKTFKNSIASVTLNEGKKLLKERLDNIMKFKKKTKICTTLSIILSFALCVMAATASTDLKPAESIQEVNNTKNNSNRNTVKTSNTSNNNTDKYNTINKLIANNRVILDNGMYHILCDGVKKKDMTTGGVTDGGIIITLEQTNGGYVCIGPVDIEKDDLEDFVKDVKVCCNKYVQDKTITKKEANLMIGLAIKLREGNGKIDEIKDISAGKKHKKEYKKLNITYKNGSYYYKDERIRIFVDLRADKSFVEFNYDHKGTVDLKVARNKNGKISKVKYLSKKEADKFLNG